MKHIEYLSPTSIALFNEGVDKFYLQYLTEDRPPKMPQNYPMAIGSAFDAYAKSYLHGKLFGKGHSDSNRFGLDAIFEAQVEPQNRDWARVQGKHAFEKYQASGALINLLTELQDAHGEPRFEFDLRGALNGYRDGIVRSVGDVILLGKPDLAFINRDGTHVVFDWKVSGWCSDYGVSPMQGYVSLRDEYGYNAGYHKKCVPAELGSLTINNMLLLNELDRKWAAQLSIYSWLLGEPIGGDFVVAIDQMVCKPTGGVPSIRVAGHRLRINGEFQKSLFDQIESIWEIVHSDHIFRDMSLVDSQRRCQILDERNASMYGPGSDPNFREFGH